MRAARRMKMRSSTMMTTPTTAPVMAPVTHIIQEH